MLTYRLVPELSTPARTVACDGIGLFIRTTCTGCGGTGEMDYDDGVDGFERRYTATCDCCDGEGYEYTETSEDELEGAQ